MATQSQIYASDYHPNIYQINLESFSFNEVLSTFVDDALQGCTVSTVESALVDYVTSIVEPVGWKAIWRSTKKSSILGVDYDFEVEVVNVSLEKLEADVYIQSIITSDSNIDIESLRSRVKSDVPVSVPLIELYTVSEGDEEELYLKTAIAIEYVRFFLLHLRRPWDAEEYTTYTEEILKPRLQLYFDMKNNILPKAMISKIKIILKQASRIQNELDMLYKEMNVSDSEAEINEEDFMQSVYLKERLSELQTKMEMLENPIIRSFVRKKYVPGKSSKRRQASGGEKPVTYVVSKQFTFEMVVNLPVETNTILEFEHNPESAFKCCSAGDKIIIFPGVYKCDTLGWMEEPVFVQGIGAYSDIVLEATGNSDVFLNCCARNVEIQNVTLKAKRGLSSTIVVHHGKLILKNCVVDSNNADVGIMLLGGAESVLENSIICNSADDGILMKSLSSLKLSVSKIDLCQRYGIQVDAENEYSTESFTELVISDSCITQNGSYGLFLNNVPLNEISLQRPSGDFSILRLFPWLKHNIQQTSLDNNGGNGIGISSAYKNNKNVSSPIIQALPNPEDLNYSALSELLNAVNMSMELETTHLNN